MKRVLAGAAVVAATAVAVASAQFAQTASMHYARRGHTATLLADGKVLVAGGYDASGNCLATAEVFDPASQTWNATASAMSTARCHHAAVLLTDESGRVFITGGVDNAGNYLQTTEEYDPVTHAFHVDERDNMRTPRAFHSAVAMERGDILVTGGYNADGYVSAVEQYRVDTPLTPWNPVGSLNVPRANHTTTRMDTGRIVVVGGQTTGGATVASAEFCTNQVYCTWAYTINDMATPRRLHTAVFLGSNDLLVSGGVDENGQASTSTELYDNGFFYEIFDENFTPRYEHVTVRLQDNTIVTFGGFDPSSGRYVDTTEFYNPVIRRWSRGGPNQRMVVDRALFTATLLPNGQILVAGGYNLLTGATNTAEIYTYNP